MPNPAPTMRYQSERGGRLGRLAFGYHLCGPPSATASTSSSADLLSIHSIGSCASPTQVAAQIRCSTEGICADDSTIGAFDPG
jgi:hypothetical protein